MDCQPPQPQAGKAVLKRSLEPTANLENSPAKSQQRAARLSSNAAGAAAQRPCNLDALPDDLFRGILDTLSKKDVGAAAATCKRFATAWRHAAGASAVLFPQLSAEGCATLRQFVGDGGKILPRRHTGLSAHHQRLLKRAVKRARNIALLPFAGEG